MLFLISFPLLNWMGSAISFRESVVLSWSGLRGAVGISLALFILLDDQISDQSFGTLTFFHMGCVAFLTIILQGTTMKPLLQVPFPSHPSVPHDLLTLAAQVCLQKLHIENLRTLQLETGAEFAQACKPK